MSLNGPLLAALRDRIADAGAAAKEGDGTNVVFNLLNAFAALGRHVAQVSWTLRHDDPDCDDLMAEDENDLVFTVIKMPIVSMVYPEFPAQVENVLRDTFQDEHFRLEDPLGWEEMNSDPSSDTEAAS